MPFSKELTLKLASKELTTKEPTALIVNPSARGNWVRRHWPQIEPMVRKILNPYWILFTREPGDGKVRTQEALAHGARFVVAFGGDGTASEVASALIQFSNTLSTEGQQRPPKFSFLSCGTGGDTRKTFQTPASLEKAMIAIRDHTPRWIDAGRINYIDGENRTAESYFINVASFGVGGLVDRLVSHSGKHLGGKITYLLKTLQATVRYQNAWVGIKVDETPLYEAQIYNLAVCNGRFFGGGMQIAPFAQVDDGFFDVVTHGNLSLSEILRMALPLYRGTHLRRAKVSLRQAKVVHAIPLRGDGPIWIDVDGEALGQLPATFTLLPNALLVQV